ncbi:hypothetical protein GCM10027049_17350 [Mucilaginibacter puniceus]
MNADLNASQSILIPFSKTKLVLSLIGSVIFVASGIAFLADPKMYSTTGFRHVPVPVIVVVGFSAVIFFGMCAIAFLLKFFDKKPGLIIDDEGIQINLGIKDYFTWGDIEGIGINKIGRSKLIILYLKNPEKYIDRQENVFKRKSMLLNFKLCGSPVTITSNQLEYSFDELYQLLSDKLSS